MSNITRRAPGFTQAVSFTTRERRLNEPADAYDFLAGAPDALKDIFFDAVYGRLVRCTVHPNGSVYGTRANAYKPPYSLVAPIPSEVEKLKNTPFQSVEPIALVASIADYRRYAAGRQGSGSPYMQPKILKEGVANLEWSLDQGPAMPWVVNSYDGQNGAADEIVAIARHERSGDPANRALGAAMLQELRSWL